MLEEELKGDKDVVKIAVKQNWRALEFADEAMKRDEEVLLEAARAGARPDNGFKYYIGKGNYKYLLLEEFKSNPEFMAKALEAYKEGLLPRAKLGMDPEGKTNYIYNVSPELKYVNYVEGKAERKYDKSEPVTPFMASLREAYTAFKEQEQQRPADVVVANPGEWRLGEPSAAPTPSVPFCR